MVRIVCQQLKRLYICSRESASSWKGCNKKSKAIEPKRGALLSDLLISDGFSL